MLAALGGAALALAFPTPAIWPLAFIALAPLILAAVAAPSRRGAFLLGIVSLTITWLINLPWVVNVMAYYGGLGYPVGIAIFIGMALLLSLWGGLFAFATRSISPDARFRTWLPIPLIWAASEYARTYLNGGFPWHLAGESLIDATWLAMWASIVGPYALSALVALTSTAIAYQFTAAERRHKIRVAVATVAVLCVVVIAGAVMTRSRRSTFEPSPSHVAALLQPNITQEMRWNNADLLAIFDRMMRMTDDAVSRKPDVIIWPESTVPMTFMSTDFYRDSVEAVSRDNNVDIILGSVAEDPKNPDRIWNTAYLIEGGEAKGRYDKIRLVPFGEYVPLRKMLFFAEKLVHAVGEFQFGTNDFPLDGKFKYGPAICYEVVFPRIPAVQVQHGADVLVTITNDAWFGDTAAPRQHLAMARMRAIETDRYLLRSATTGISAVVDPTGHIVEQLPLNHQGMIMARFSTRQSITPYVRFGDWFAVAAVAATLISLLVRRKAFVHE